MSVLVQAHAKLNLHLAVLAREASGYHSIETVFHRIELADDVVVNVAPPGTRMVRCSVDVGPMEQNLAYRAAVAFLDATEWDTGFDIQILKRIPAGGGLGGGSADAAATLRGLNAMCPTLMPQQQLMAIASGLGADVPFLASDAVMALAWGRGERMLSLDPLPLRHVALAIPPFRVATADAYKWLDDSRLATSVPEVRELRYWHLANWEELAPHVSNDFESVIANQFAEVQEIVQALRTSGAVLAGMTGSGSTCFGIYKTPPDQALLERATQCSVVVTQTSGHHALPTRAAMAALI
ncbi:MAG TPA: 4-(cytidine 5'-diphospho)-2-C-methyl-D-erythritol kinase [Gemmatimonadaceae bacterium]|nr:4-(cytidine 5'-diphospho)-2-C-methyl-D-erythritol kinase [Gemmatimonadaceae bacterium]